MGPEPGLRCVSFAGEVFGPVRNVLNDHIINIDSCVTARIYLIAFCRRSSPSPRIIISPWFSNPPAAIAADEGIAGH
jgi:hypothetical protein